MHAGKSMDLKFTEMMESFIKDEGDECTWSTVYSALESMSNNRLAKKIREKYGEGKSKGYKHTCTCIYTQ